MGAGAIAGSLRKPTALHCYSCTGGVVYPALLVRPSTRMFLLLAAALVGCATAPAHAGTPLRVMTFNIKSGLYGLPNVARVIREAQPDVVALQEVDVGARRSG